MTTQSGWNIDLDAVSPSRLIKVLTQADWEQVGGRAGIYHRYAARGSVDTQRGPTIVVPLDRTAPDYPALIASAVADLERARGDKQGSEILARLLTTSTDEVSFVKETAAPRGWIRWDDGMDLYTAARKFLAASAKRTRQRSAYYGNRYGVFANRFLDEVMMGQTAISSFVVRAYVPAEVQVPLHSGRDEERPALFGDAVAGREISEALVDTLAAATEALDHYRSQKSLAGFTDPQDPISYEAVQALRTIASGADDSRVRVTWENGDPDQPAADWDFVFTPAAVPVLERAATALIQPVAKPETRASGVVHLLTRAEAEGPGVIGITTISGKPANKLRVRLDDDDYHRAINAHDQDEIVHVVGTLEREGNLSWLYDARIAAVTGVPPPTTLSSQATQPPLFALPESDQHDDD